MSSPVRGRLAPSPTGLLHLGNAWSFLLAWLSARLAGGEVILRMEDIDPQRATKAWAEEIIRDLSWLGLNWDGKIFWQSERGRCYERALAELGNLVYPCFCTRKELRELAGAPQQTSSPPFAKKTAGRFSMPDTGVSYSGICRRLTQAERAAREAGGHRPALRLACPPFGPDDTPYRESLKALHDEIFPSLSGAPAATVQTPIFSRSLAEKADSPTRYESIPSKLFSKLCSDFKRGLFPFEDMVLGRQEFFLSDCGGDFAVRRSDGVWAYQLAVSVDDGDMGITQVVRGEDILTSTPRQLYLMELLGYEAPRYAHVPLILDETGERLAKRHTAPDSGLTLRFLREHGAEPERVVAFLMELAGIQVAPQSPAALCERLRLDGAQHFPWEKLRPSGKALRVENRQIQVFCQI